MVEDVPAGAWPCSLSCILSQRALDGWSGQCLEGHLVISYLGTSWHSAGKHHPRWLWQALGSPAKLWSLSLSLPPLLGPRVETKAPWLSQPACTIFMVPNCSTWHSSAVSGAWG